MQRPLIRAALGVGMSALAQADPASASAAEAAIAADGSGVPVRIATPAAGPSRLVFGPGAAASGDAGLVLTRALQPSLGESHGASRSQAGLRRGPLHLALSTELELRMSGIPRVGAGTTATRVAGAGGTNGADAIGGGLASGVSRLDRASGVSGVGGVSPVSDTRSIGANAGTRSRPDSTASVSSPGTTSAAAALAEQARFWSTQSRDDLAEEALAKLFRLDPQNLQGLEVLARLQIRRRQPEAVRKTIERMRRLQPQSRELARTEALLRVDGADREALRAIRQLAREDRFEEAAAAMRALYPDGPPTEDMTLEYWALVADAPNGRPRARAGLQELVRNEPNNPRYRLALDAFLTARAPVDRSALARIIALADSPAYGKRARVAWRGAMLALDDSPANLDLLRNYLALEQNDSAVQTRLARMRVSLEARRKILADPNYQAQRSGIALLSAGNVEAAQAPLQRAYASRANDIDLLNALALLRLRQHRHAESEALFLRAAQRDPGQRDRWLRMASVARYWGLLTQADTASAAGQVALAEEKIRAAHALDPAQPAAMLALASLYADNGRVHDAETTYERILSDAPGNADALSGLIRLYLAQADDERAQRLLAQLTPTQRSALQPRIDAARVVRLRDRADALSAAGDTGAAIALLEQAAPLAPDDPWLRYDLGRLYVKRHAEGDAERADGLFSALLRRQPGDAPSLYAYALLDDNRDRTLPALRTLEQIPTEARERKIVLLQRRLWVSLRVRRAALLTASDRAAQACALLLDTARAIGVDPELAPQIADALIDTGSAGVVAARALLDRTEADVGTVAGTGTGARISIGIEAGGAPAQRLPFEWYLRRAELVARFGDDAELQQAVDALDARARRLAAQAPLPVADRGRIADLHVTLLAHRIAALQKQGDAAGAYALLQHADIDDASGNRRLQLLRADTALAAQHHAEAEAGYRQILQAAPGDFDASLGLIDSLIAAGQPQQARLLLEQYLARRQAAAATATDTSTAADAKTDASAHPGNGLSANEAASLASRLMDLREDAAALALIDSALAGSPDNVRLLNQAAQLAERGNRPEQAIAYLQHALAVSHAGLQATAVAPTDKVGDAQRLLAGTVMAGASPRLLAGEATPGGAYDDAQVPGEATQTDAAGAPIALPAGESLLSDLQIDSGGTPGTPADSTYKRLADLLDARSTWAAGALDLRSRSGSAGTSRYTYAETPLELRMPWRDGSHVFVQAALVRTSAGTLDLGAAGNAAQFGSVLLCQPQCIGGGAAQDATGLGLAAGIDRGEWRADIGATPLGFPVQNLVGGILKKGDLGSFSYSIDASRRALMGSVLSYAGARDPRTGEIWGGVLANGVRLGLSRDAGGSFGAWSSLGLHRLTGTNVQGNNRMQLMGGGYWRLINEDDRLLTVGTNAMLWHFSENAGEYTFGHGGYYSPQHFASVALPITFGQRSARFSYSVRGALSVSRSSTAGADYFPTRPDLQTQADALAPFNGTDTHYTASNGRGIGRSLSAAFEYQMQPKLFVGGRLEIDRSTDYAPNRLLFYFRYDLDHDSARPVVFPPEPLVPASQY